MLVIAKFKEDISWSDGLERTIYDKSKDIPNVGREAETYLRYIVDNYDNLPNVITFCQGNPFDHVPDFLDIYKEVGFMGLDHTTYRFKDLNHPVPLPTKEIADELGIELPDEWKFKAGAQFTLSKEMILKYNKDFYIKTRELINKYEKAPWVLERLWVHIFK